MKKQVTDVKKQIKKEGYEKGIDRTISEEYEAEKKEIKANNALKIEEMKKICDFITNW